ncbi:uncharacterized protein LOC133836775 [Drosophila sulfurigaster albostrigata]|uniref:uncharacterized protein LOC133836775 n=1 Tax=Drosophila sulfurigaster albostrigata TaxID=89887 RepID=UPI002D21CF42|nr:uncharacterized protein LOC133836775 [Drosophila sulfurigaster albostrigata]
MKPIARWLVSITAGLLAGTQTIRMVKVANEDNEYYCAHCMYSSAVQSESESTDLPYIMGSEQISAALQQILSSDEHNVAMRPRIINNIQKDCELGSESLNRLLEEMMSSSTSNENSELIHFEPAVRL